MNWIVYCVRDRSGGARGPGVFFVLPCIDNYCKVDLRTVSFDVPPQEVLSKDSVTVSVDAVVYYRISDPLKAVIQVGSLFVRFIYFQRNSTYRICDCFTIVSGGKLQSFHTSVGGHNTSQRTRYP